MKKKLMVVAPYFYPKIGGMENYAWNISLGLKQKHKWEVVVITSNHKEKKYKEEKIKGIKIYRLPYWFKISNTPINPMWYFEIKKIIKNEKPDMINAHTPVPFITDITAFAVGKIPFFVTYHAYNLYKNNFSLLNILINIYKQFEYILFKKADKILIVSDVIKDSIPDKFHNKVKVIYNSISKQGLPKYRIQKTNKFINLLFIGSLDKSHAWKGLKEIINAIKIYVDKYGKDIKLYIIGDGDDKKNYVNLTDKLGINKNVTFCGKKVGRDKKNVLDKSMIGIIYPSSSNDAFPTVALEYWANSLPIIASNIVPISKIFVNKRTAYLVNPKNPNALVSAIINLSSNRSLQKNISKFGYKELRNKYLLENEVKKFNLLTKGFVL